MDSSEWIALPKAIEAVQSTKHLSEMEAREWLFHKVSQHHQEISSKICLRIGWNFGGPPEHDVTMQDSTWGDLSDMEGPWWTTGHASLGGQLKYRFIEILRRDLVMALDQYHHAAPSATVDLSHAGESGPKAKRGRTPGTGFQKADEAIWKKMDEAIQNDTSLNATSAARMFAPSAKGATIESKIDRLARGYRKWKKREK